MADDRTSAFSQALQRFEENRDLDAFAQVFSDDATLLRPEQTGAALGVRKFWQGYLDQFSSVGSSFHRIVESGDIGELEWESKAVLSGGAEVTYAGVSLLEFDGAGRVSRFATYYDTAALTRPAG